MLISVDWLPPYLCPSRRLLRSSRLQKNRVKRTSSLRATCGEGRRGRVCLAPLVVAVSGAGGRRWFLDSSRGLGQIPDADQVIDRQAEDEHPVHPCPAAVPCLAQQPDRLEPAEDLFDALALP